jgi:hypothetical protein
MPGQICIGVQCGGDLRDPALLQFGRDAVHVLSPIQVGIDQQFFGMSSGEQIEIGEIVRAGSNGSRNLSDQ